MLFLGIDLGTSGTKAVLVDERGRAIASATAEHPISTPHPGWSEQAPEDWWRSTIAAVRAVLGAIDDAKARIRGIGLSGQMHGLVMLDGFGRVLRPCILWNDQRSADLCAAFEDRTPLLLAATGNRMLPGFLLPKLLWCRRHEPLLERAARTHLLPKDWLRFRMSGVRATEPSDASGTSLFDCRHRRWSQEIAAAFDVDPATLPPSSESVVATASLTADAAAELGLREGTPIVGGAGDQAASAIGAGIVREGAVSATIGTSGVVFAASERWRSTERGEAHAFCHAVPERWHLMGVMLSCGGSLRWFRDAFGYPAGDAGYEAIMRDAASSEPGARGAIFLPYLTGERCPHPEPRARGAFVDLDPSQRRADLARAVVEGITFGLRDNLDLIRGLGVGVESVRLAGGGARSPFWRALCADVFGAPVETTHADAGGALGVALLAGVGTSHWRSVDDAVASADGAFGRRSVVEPTAASAYGDAYARFRAAFGRSFATAT
jgi:xylulokinase